MSQFIFIRDCEVAILTALEMAEKFPVSKYSAEIKTALDSALNGVRILEKFYE